MTDYNFLNLSPYEFEILSRDLLQKHLACHIESFSSGADKGIDLRCFLYGNVIIQCKRYNDFSSLQTSLKEEVEKVKKLKPGRYILTTSVGLTPERKNKIFKLFSPFILSEDDIMGKEDLNNFLAQYPEIEKSHFKLWLSSINILQEIINRNIVNQTQFKLEEIKEKIKIYVQNDSYFEAIDILKENKYVIISGIPGIGKSTLAEMLVYRLLAGGIEEFIFLSDSIQEGYKMYNSEKSQVFLFDDFLGRNFLEGSLNTNEESLIIRFIHKINQSNNKFLIFTTREYILNQAKLRYDLFDNEEFVKCVIDLSKYTKLAKAKILYNHLFFFGVPIEYVNHIAKREYLFKILEHRNYNPRIVEALSKSKKWKELSPIDFPSYMLSSFENPSLIWKHTFENGISQKSRVLLYALLLLDGGSNYNELYLQVQIFTERTLNKYSENFDSITYKNSLKELENTFIEIKPIQNTHNQNIKYQNPSIQDFLMNYIDKDNNLKSDLIQSAIYLNLLLKLFDKKDIFGADYRLSLTNNLINSINREISNRFDCIHYHREFYIGKLSEEDIVLEKLYEVANFSDLTKDYTLDKFILTRLTQIMYSDKINKSLIHKLLSLIKRYKSNLEVDMERLLKHLIKKPTDFEDLFAFNKLREVNSEDFDLFIKCNYDDYFNYTNSVVSSLVDNASQEDSEELKNTLEIIEQIADVSNINFDDERGEIEQLIEEKESEYEPEYEDWDDRPRNSGLTSSTEDSMIIDLFTSYQ